MKHFILLLSLVFAFSLKSNAQSNATDFVANDCAGTEHGLFGELNAGDVVVISWVMPCSQCLNPALTASSAVQGFATSHPGRVKYYVVDDYANTSCQTVTLWASNNGILVDATFSDSKIKMSDYGTDGMPKTIVLGGHGHQVFFNTNGTINGTDVQNAITAAIAIANTKEPAKAAPALKISPNPAPVNSTINLEFQLSHPCGNEFRVQLYDITGKMIRESKPGPQNGGPSSVSTDLSGIQAGIYQMRICGNSEILNSRLIIN